MNLNHLLAILFTVVSISSSAQTRIGQYSDPRPEVGKRCPEFTLTRVTHYPKSRVELGDFKGKWLFLDFWFTGCSACIKSLPKISEFQSEFSTQAQFLMVGYNARRYERNIEEVFEKLRKRQGLNIAIAYDSTLAHKWGVESMPHIVIIDPGGVVRFVTDGSDMTKEKISRLLKGDDVTFLQKGGATSPSFEGSLMGYGGKEFPRDKILLHSVLTKWNGERVYPGFPISEYARFPASELENRSFRYAGVSLEWLYNTAYFGRSSGLLKFWGDSLYAKVYPFPVLEVSDSKPFEVSYDTERPEGLYNYNLVIPPERVTQNNLMTFMQEDLTRAFRYNAFVEEREMPVWKLTATPEAQAKIKTKGGAPHYDGWEGKSIVAGFSVRNIPMKDYIKYLCFYLREEAKHPFIDDTGIKHNIDLTIDADLTSFKDVRRALRQHGLDLVKGLKRMKVLVLRDASN